MVSENTVDLRTSRNIFSVLISGLFEIHNKCPKKAIFHQENSCWGICSIYSFDHDHSLYSGVLEDKVKSTFVYCFDVYHCLSTPQSIWCVRRAHLSHPWILLVLFAVEEKLFLCDESRANWCLHHCAIIALFSCDETSPRLTCLSVLSKMHFKGWFFFPFFFFFFSSCMFWEGGT